MKRRHRLVASTLVVLVLFAAPAGSQTPPVETEMDWGRYIAATSRRDTIGGVARTASGGLVIAMNEGDDIVVAKVDKDGFLINRTRALRSGVAAGIAVDHLDNVYVVGSAVGSVPTTPNALMPNHPIYKLLGLIPLPFESGGRIGFIAKFTPDLNHLLYSSYLGGDGEIGSFLSPFPGGSLVMRKLAKIRLRWSLNPGNSAATAVAVRPGTSQVYIAGWTESGAFPTTHHAVQTDSPGTWFLTDKKTAFVAVIDTEKSGEQSMLYGTYLGSNCVDEALAIAVDINGEALVTGRTEAERFDGVSQFLCGSFVTTSNQIQDHGRGFLTRLLAPERAVTDHLLYSTYLDEPGIAVAVRKDGGADVIEGTPNSLALTRVSWHDPLVIDRRIPLGTGMNAAITTVMGNKGLYPPVSQVLFYNQDGGAAVAALIPAGGGELQEIARVDGMHATAVAADGNSIFLGGYTWNQQLPSVGLPAAGQNDGYIAEIPFNTDPTDDGANVVFVRTPGNLVVPATSPQGAVVSFQVTADYWFDGSHPPVTCDHASESTFGIGDTLVKCTVDQVDAPGAQVLLGKFQITVTNIPKLTVPASLVAAAEDGRGGHVVWPNPTAHDVFSVLEPECDHQNGSLLPLGITEITCTAAGRDARVMDRFTVTVVDNDLPTVEMDPPFSRVLHPWDPAGAAFWFSASAHDLIDGPLTPTCTWPGGSASTFPVAVTFPVGSFNEIVCAAVDAAGHRQWKSITVRVTGDRDGPGIGGVGPVVLTWKPEGNVVFFASDQTACDALAQGAGGQDGAAPVCLAITAWDRFDGVRPVVCNGVELGPQAVAMPFGVGSWEVRCTSVDLSGNASTGILTVSIMDSDAPVLVGVPEDITKYAEPDGWADVSWPLPTAADTMDGDLEYVVPDRYEWIGPGQLGCQATINGDPTWLSDWGRFPQGLSRVLCVAQDRGFKQTMVQFTVTITPPRPTIMDLRGPGERLTPDGNWWLTSSDSATFTIEANMPGEFHCSLDGEVLSPCTSPVTYTSLAPGFHLFVVAGVNENGMGDLFDYPWIVESALPDTEAPVVLVPGDMTLTTQNLAGVVATFPVSAVDGVDGALEASCLPASGSLFAPGATPVTCTAQDRAGNTNAATFFVTVIYAAPPLQPTARELFEQLAADPLLAVKRARQLNDVRKWLDTGKTALICKELNDLLLSIPRMRSLPKAQRDAWSDQVRAVMAAFGCSM